MQTAHQEVVVDAIEGRFPVYEQHEVALILVFLRGYLMSTDPFVEHHQYASRGALALSETELLRPRDDVLVGEALEFGQREVLKVDFHDVGDLYRAQRFQLGSLCWRLV